MNEQDYYYNVELLKLLLNINNGNWDIADRGIRNLRKKIDEMFNEERKETDDTR